MIVYIKLPPVGTVESLSTIGTLMRGMGHYCTCNAQVGLNGQGPAVLRICDYLQCTSQQRPGGEVFFFFLQFGGMLVEFKPNHSRHVPTCIS